ncbi:MAG: PIN domain-containing protein [Acidobacteria bacterium]|nr:PIN domain-containing protein [Acidobacteriota bacterium]
MGIAYVDTSCVAAIVFGEPGSVELAAELDGLDELRSSNLLEAELRAACKREGKKKNLDLYLAQVAWIYPTRPLRKEFERLTEAGYIRGADLWHLACALYLDPKADELAFASLDRQQRDLARRVGFKLLPAEPAPFV